jgi:hypothetical protein
MADHRCQFWKVYDVSGKCSSRKGSPARVAGTLCVSLLQVISERVRLSITWAASDIRRLLEKAAASDTHKATEQSTSQPMDAIVSATIRGSTRGSFVLKSAAPVDLLIALLSLFVSSRAGRRRIDEDRIAGRG